MNTEMTLNFGPVFVTAILVQQLFVVYAIHRIFIRPNDGNSIRGETPVILKARYTREEINAGAYDKLKQEFTCLRT